jgi:hypothetical protein
LGRPAAGKEKARRNPGLKKLNPSGSTAPGPSFSPDTTPTNDTDNKNDSTTQNNSYFRTLAAIYVCFFCWGCAQPKAVGYFSTIKIDRKDTASVKFFLTKDFSAFDGKPVATFLQNLERPYKYKGFHEEPLFHAGGLDLVYSDNLYVALAVKGFEHMNPYDTSRVWDLDEFYKEKLDKVEIFYKNQCIKGCYEYPVKYNF